MCRLVTTDLATALGERPTLVTVLVGVADPGNAGTVIRTSDAAGAGAVVLAGEAVDPHNGKCVRASTGSLFHVPLAHEPDPRRAVEFLRDAGLNLVATSAHAERELGPDTDDLLGVPTAWLFGGEAHGLDDAVSAAADERVRIPIRGRAESLNLASAAAVCLYASARAQRTPSAG